MPQNTRVPLPRTVMRSLSVLCPHCAAPAIKAGMRHTQHGPIQKYYCAECRRHFSSAPIPRRQYTANVILNAITTYNLGSTLAATRRSIAQRFKHQVPESTLHSWLAQFAHVCTFIRYRKQFSLSEEDAIVSRVFNHRQEYRFAFHRLKTNILCKVRAR